MIYKRGFTMIELLVVVGIIGILSSIVIVATKSASDKSRDSKVRSQLAQMNSQSLLFNGTLGTSYYVSIPYKVSDGITGAQVGGTPSSGTLFNDTTLTHNSLYLLAKTLPSNTYIDYAWNGQSNTLTGRWFFAATTSTGAFCVDWTSGKKEYVGNAIASDPTDLGNWTDAFPNTSSGSGLYSCN